MSTCNRNFIISNIKLINLSIKKISFCTHLYISCSILHSCLLPKVGKYQCRQIYHTNHSCWYGWHKLVARLQMALGKKKQDFNHFSPIRYTHIKKQLIIMSSAFLVTAQYEKRIETIISFIFLTRPVQQSGWAWKLPLKKREFERAFASYPLY